MTIYVFLSHDVDWPIQGAPRDHILLRRHRFSSDTIGRLNERNPYFNIPEYMDIEEELGVRSTWFFRVHYPSGNYYDYSGIIKTLVKKRWEIGLHLEPDRIENRSAIQRDKQALEKIVGQPIHGNRVHYARYTDTLAKLLEQEGFLYDSSKVFDRQRIVNASIGVYVTGGLLEFPITVVDAFLFTYLKTPEKKVVETVCRVIDNCRKSGLKWKVVTLIWHNCVLQMKGGRVYPSIVESLLELEDVKILPG
ncbi:MAG: hypothetical protein ACTSYO_02905, partial [Candidatus Ranarchaeia archaeon]